MAYADANSDIAVGSPQVPAKKKVVVLGTGWAGTSFLRNLDSSAYDVHVLSPRNYFAFTPLLPSVTCGTVEARSIVEPIRKIIKKVKMFFLLTQNTNFCFFHFWVFLWVLFHEFLAQKVSNLFLNLHM